MTVRVKFNKKFTTTFFNKFQLTFNENSCYDVIDCGSHWLYDVSYSANATDEVFIKIPSHYAEIITFDSELLYPEIIVLSSNSKALYFTVYSGSKVIHRTQVTKELIKGTDYKFSFVATENYKLTKIKCSDELDETNIPLELDYNSPLSKDITVHVNIPVAQLDLALKQFRTYFPSFQFEIP